jgi:hypothetical protein
MMRLLGIGSVAVCLLAGAPVVAQSTADAYFHEGAQAYVAGDRAAARRAVERGLEVAPTDPRLIALRTKLRQSGRPEGQRDSSATASGRRSQQSENAPSDEATEGGEDPSPSENEGPPQSGPRDPASAEASRPGQRQASRRPTDGAPQAEARRRGGGRPVDTLSRAQAERLLRALEGQERQLLRQLRTRSARRQQVEKDW